MNKKETEVILQRIRKWYDRLPGLFIYDQRDFDAQYGWSKEATPFKDRLSLDYKTIKEGDAWGSKWESAWFHLNGQVPEEWKGKSIAANLDFSGEGLVFNNDGKSVLGEKGELVCKSPFPALPIGVWNDNLKEKYKETYYKKFPNVWYHGDYAELTTNNGIIIYGRSDATLNPGGVRIGTAEIYREVEKLDVVLESIAVGKDIQDDIEIILFVVLQEGKILNKKLEEIIRDKIKKNISPRHVPKRIFQVNEIPRTKSGKIVELAVRDVIHGREIKNIEAIANPDSLQYFSNLDIY